MKQQNCNDMKIQRIYDKIMYKINTDKKYEGYESTDCANALNPNTEKDVARQIYRYFPTHFYKVRKTFEVIETESKNTAASLMLQNKISLIDVGSGTCTMLLGLLDYLDEQRNNTYYPMQRIRVDVLLIEKCKHYNEIIDIIIDSARKEYDVDIKYAVLNDIYPSKNTINEINKFILNTQSDYIIYSFCNVAKSFAENNLDDNVISSIANTINTNRNKYFLNLFITPYKS
ncbi:MAG: hypothetical protein QME46_11955, partial [Thermoanaerobacteraceae bacterium]|nr:hypothetical protein [Thermoanaerobacteraceae bacterium]